MNSSRALTHPGEGSGIDFHDGGERQLKGVPRILVTLRRARLNDPTRTVDRVFVRCNGAAIKV
jgi:hypothetical protein